MNRKNILLAAILALVLAGVCLAAWLTTRPAPAVRQPEPAAGSAQEPAEGGEPEATAGSAPASADNGVRGYLVVTTAQASKVIPLTKAGKYTISQKNGAQNVVRVTGDSIEMLSSTCENQICVHEGVVTLDNKATRILGNYIYCLPNNVTLELLTAAEYAERYPAAAANDAGAAK